MSMAKVVASHPQGTALICTILIGGGAPPLPLKSGFRFSRKARAVLLSILYNSRNSVIFFVPMPHGRLRGDVG
jgi:hypothetical protein